MTALIPPFVLLATFTVAIFLNAALLFAVEPMFTKMVLPLLGGAPAVWNTCLLFYQGALLAGYLYAHVTSRWLSASRQAALHVALLATSVALLPITLAGSPAPPTGGTGPAVTWLLARLATTLGIPFVLLAAGAPMLQRWFATTRHPRAANPYFLYVASNAGSFVALLAYPTLVEPTLRLSEQSEQWARGYWVLMALVLVAGGAAWMWRAGGRAGPGDSHAAAGDSPPAGAARDSRDDDGALPLPTIVPTRAWRLRWVLLSFAPSSLLLGVTTFLGTDIASVPFLWVVPLALYLLTFVLVFARRPLLNRRVVLALEVVLALTLIVVIGANPARRLTAVAALHLLTFFVMAMACHRELADARPRAEHLTEFYLWMSLGGVLGGVFNVLLAPVLYDRVLEYPLAIIVALGLRPMWNSRTPPRRALFLDVALPLLLFAVVTVGYHLPALPVRWGDYAVYGYLGACAAIAATFYKRPLRLAMGAAAIYLGTDLGLRAANDTIFQGRSFFGVYRVRRWENYVLLQHGTTTHGGQSVVASRKTDPLTYYHREGPLGDLFRYVTDSVGARSVALVGLGAGTTACYSRPGEQWTYYEIDPLVVAIARTPALFTYLADCQPNVRIVIGDARLSLAAAPDSSFDLITLDAFSSDAIPVHLMTREALQLYARKLRPGGIVAFHISNRYLDLRPVLVELARDAHLAGAMVDRDVNAAQKAKLYYGSRWVALAASAHTLAPLVREAGWQVLSPSAPVRVWTDDFSDVLGVMK